MGRAIVLPLNTIAILTGASILTGYFLGRWSANTARGNGSAHIDAARGTGNKNKSEGAFVLLVNMQFASLSHRDAFLEWIEPVCEDVRANEGPVPLSSAGGGASLGSSGSTGTTLSYKVAISDKDPLTIVVMERYSDKERGYLEVHRSGDEFLNFRDRLKGMQEGGDVVITGESYLETDLGYV